MQISLPTTSGQMEWRDMVLDVAGFEPFIWRDQHGRLRTANQMPGAGRFRVRHWPVRQMPPRGRLPHKKTPMRNLYGQRINRSIEQASQLSALRRWLPANPLDAYQMRVEDAVHLRLRR